MGAVRAKERAEQHDFEKGVESKYHILYGEDLAKPLPPKPWLVKGLGIAPGPPTILGGAGFGGKTMAAQTMALAIATGAKLWGQFDVRQGEVLHLDWEQDELTVRRYQRMARSKRVNLADLRRMLGASLTPNASLDDEGSERALAYLCTGKALCIIDSFRGAFRRAQENDSTVYDHLAMLKRVSVKTGCVMLLIAHARKMSDDKDIRSSLRGSGAMFDASATVYMLDAIKGKPTRVTNTKERNTGKLREDFGLRIVDDIGPRIETSEPGDDDMDPEWGLHIEYLSAPELQAEYMIDDDRADNVVALNAERIASLGKRIGDILAGSAHGQTPTMIASMLKGATSLTDIKATLEHMVANGIVWREGQEFSLPTREPGED